MGSYNGLDSERSPRYNFKTDIQEDANSKLMSYKKQFDINMSRIHAKKKQSNVSMLEYTARMREVHNSRWNATSPMEIKARYITRDKASHKNIRKHPVLLDGIVLHERKIVNFSKVSNGKAAEKTEEPFQKKSSKNAENKHIGISFVSVADLCDIAQTYTPKQSFKMKPLHTEHKPSDSRLIRLDIKPSVKISKSSSKIKPDTSPIPPDVSAITDYNVNNIDKPLVPNEMTFQYLAEALRLNINKLSSETKKKRSKKRTLHLKNPALEAIPENDTISVKSPEIVNSGRVSSPPLTVLSPRKTSKPVGLSSISEDEVTCGDRFSNNSTQNTDSHHGGTLPYTQTDIARHSSNTINAKSENELDATGADLNAQTSNRKNKNKSKAHKRIRKLIYLRDR